MQRTLEFQFRMEVLSAAAAWHAILPWFIEVHGKPAVCLNHDPIDFEWIGGRLEGVRMRWVSVGDANDKSLAGLGDYPTAGVHHLKLHRLPDSTPPVEDLLCRLPTNELVFGHESDGDYVKWQVERDPWMYDRKGRSHDHLPKYWDEYVEEERIDISNNPGRWDIINHKYIEAVGSPMWIGPLFAERTSGDWRGMKDYDWCEITELEGGVVRLTSWDGPFDSDQGEQRERQEILRKVLFPNPAE